MFARHYLRNLGWFLFLRLLRCFSSPGSLYLSYVFRQEFPCGRVSPFGHPRIKARLSAPRGLTQTATSFIACNRQGIHHMHLFTWPYNVETLQLLCYRFCSKALWTVQILSNSRYSNVSILQSIKPIEHFNLITKLICSLYFFHFVKERYFRR